MRIFITGTNTNIGKTLVSSWLCAHSDYSYFKPIQTGNIEGNDSATVRELAECFVYKEAYSFKEPLSPHLASSLENTTIDINNITLPSVDNLIIEGAGGVLVPLNKEFKIIDLIEKLKLPTIIVASSALGTINHTLLTLEVLRAREIAVLGVIMSGELNEANKEAIELYGNTKVLACLPFLTSITKDILKEIPLTKELKEIL